MDIPTTDPKWETAVLPWHSGVQSEMSRIIARITDAETVPREIVIEAGELIAELRAFGWVVSASQSMQAHSATGL